MKAVSFMYVRPPGYNAESAKAAEIADEKKSQHPLTDDIIPMYPFHFLSLYLYCFPTQFYNHLHYVSLVAHHNLCPKILLVMKRRNQGQKMFLGVLYQPKKNSKFWKMLHGMFLVFHYVELCYGMSHNIQLILCINCGRRSLNINIVG